MKSERGQAVVELALSLPLLLILLFGMIDFGRVITAYMSLEHAGREAARSASIGADNTEVYSRAKAAAQVLDPNRLTVQISPESGRVRGTYVTITASYSVNISTPIIQNFLPDPYIVRSKTVMRVE